MAHRDMAAALVNAHALSNVAATIHPNANTHIAAASPHSGHAITAAGTYSGNSSANRAIPHGLGKIPTAVFFQVRNATYKAYGIIIAGTAYIYAESGANAYEYTVTAADATNFYVGNASSYDPSMNGPNWTPIYWVAIG